MAEFLYRHCVPDCGPVRGTMYSQNSCRLIAQLVSLSITIKFSRLELIVIQLILSVRSLEYTAHIICAI